MHIFSKPAVKNKKFCPVGKLVPGVQAVVVNEDLQPQPAGVVGEVGLMCIFTKWP